MEWNRIILAFNESSFSLIDMFDPSVLLTTGINLVLIGAGWGKLYTQVREVTKWKESKENDPLNQQLQTGLIKQAEIFERFSEHFERLDDQIKILMKEPIELGLSRFENRFANELRNTYADRKSIELQLGLVKESINQLSHRITGTEEHIRMLLEKIVDEKINKR